MYPELSLNQQLAEPSSGYIFFSFKYYLIKVQKVSKSNLIHLCSKEVRRVSFTQRVVTTWNELPEHVLRTPTLNAFKNRIDKRWKNHPHVFDSDCY